VDAEMNTIAESAGSSARCGPLWGARARDWARNEEQQVSTYEAALARVEVRPGDRVLDLGCGTGVFLELVAERGAERVGLDASEELLEIARERLPGADLRRGDLESLPFADDGFDLVTGFNSFFFAADMTAALREAGRVAKPGAPVVIQVWGDPERCELEAMKVIARRFQGGGEAPPPLWKPGVLEGIAAEAGLTPEDAFDVGWAYEFADDAELGRAMISAGGLSVLAGPDRLEEVEAAILEVLAPYRNENGGYRLANEFRILIARA
jgi:SAM-dependent methyltransferase